MTKQTNIFARKEWMDEEARGNALPQPLPVIPSMTEVESRLLELRVELRRSVDELLHGFDRFQTVLCGVLDELKEQGK